MLFNSFAYLLFLPTVFLLYWALPWKWRNPLLVAASFLFYGWWDLRFLCLMVVTCAINYVLAVIMGEKSMSGEKKQKRHLLCTTGVVINFVILGIFKYYNFFAENLAALFSTTGWEFHPTFLNVILPVGISFYTFQVTGYLIDVYRGTMPPTRNITQFFAFISFFPQLVAGPIERAGQLLPQFFRPTRFSRPLAVEGMQQLLWGLMKKMLLADNCATVADYVFTNSATVSMTDLWMGALCFAFQIYGDFSGYSDMAIGSAKLFGIRLMRNFDRPYLATSIPDFWRRWHISLMTWFRDYLYIPLGGNRKGKGRKMVNTATVFLVSGLWHGANWTFIFWGLYHALLFIPSTLLHRENRQETRICNIAKGTLTFLLVVLGWVLFRSTDLSQAFSYLVRMFDLSRLGSLSCSRMPLVFIVLFMLAEACSKHEHPLAIQGHGLLRHRAARFALYYGLFLFTLLAGGKAAQFIYFQF